MIIALTLLAPTSKLASKVTRPAGQTRAESLRLRSRAAVAIDLENRVILYSKNITDQRCIASITKLVTTLVFLDVTKDLDVPIIILPEDRTSQRSNFRVGNSYRLIDLLHGTLMSSDNLATRTLMRSTGFGEAEFVRRMNQKAQALGLTDSYFADPTGLDTGNISTALDCAKLIDVARQDSLISSISTKREYQCYSLLKKRRVQLANTNNLLRNSNLEVIAGKTGFIRRSGYCLATCIGDHNGKKIVFVVLGAPSNNSRFQEMYKLIRWTSRNYNLGIS